MTDNDTEHKLFSFDTGMPTGPDVDALDKHWPDLKHGDFLPYDELGQVVGKEHGTQRFRTVINAWRKRLQHDKRLCLLAVKNTGLKVATSGDLLGITYDTTESIRRKARRHRMRLHTITAKDSEEQTIQEHHMRLMLQTERHAKSQRMNLLPSAEPQQLPQLKPPATASQKETNNA